jgi:cell wall-associated NlpC family hydrolase
MLDQLATISNQEHIARQNAIREALEWVGTPFIHEACVKGIGVDCTRLLTGVYERAGVMPKFEPAHISPGWCQHKDAPGFNPERFLKDILQFGHEVDEPLPGDAVLFWLHHAYAHMAIVIEWPTHLIHCIERGGVQAVNALEDPYMRRYRSTHPPRFFSPFRKLVM